MILFKDNILMVYLHDFLFNKKGIIILAIELRSAFLPNAAQTRFAARYERRSLATAISRVL